MPSRGCESCYPSCVPSPTCGNGNDPLAKPGPVRLLDVVFALLPPAASAGDSAPDEAADVEDDGDAAGATDPAEDDLVF